MTAPGHHMRCDYAGCSNKGTVEHEAWMFCDQHSTAGRTLGATTRPRPTAVPTPPAAKPVVHLDDTTVQPAIPAVTSPIGQLLEQGTAHSVTKVRRLAERIETQLDELHALIAEHAADERRKAAEAAAAAKARAEVERLEQQLAEAKAKLKTTSPGTGRGNRAPRTPAQIAAATATLAKARAAKAAKASA